MAIVKRSTPEERAKKELGINYKRALRHPLLQSLAYIGYDTSPIKVTKALANVRGWKGASYEDKTFIYLLASIMWRGFGTKLLTNENYDRLGKHLREHAADLLAKCHLGYHQAVVWDAPTLRMFGEGQMQLPQLKTLRKPKKTVKPKKKRVLIRKKKR